MDIGAVESGQKKEQFDGAIHLLKTQKYVQCCNIFPFISKKYVGSLFYICILKMGI
jgi:hypothetical protein